MIEMIQFCISSFKNSLTSYNICGFFLRNLILQTSQNVWCYSVVSFSQVFTGLSGLRVSGMIDIEGDAK